MLSTSGTPSVLGAGVTFTADVTPSAATGTVTFKDGTTTLGTGQLASGVATFTTTTLAAGSHSITAVYAGDANDATSTSSPVTQTVNKDASTISSTSAPATVNYGSSYTVTGSIAAANGLTPTGTVTVQLGSGTGAKNIMTATVVLNAGAFSATFSSVTLNVLSSGTYAIQASYSGDANFLSAALAPLTPSVGGADTLTVNAEPIIITAGTATKTYDGTMATSVKPTITTGSLVGTDTDTLSETFASRNAGSESLTPAYTMNDSNAGADYSVTIATAAGKINAEASRSWPLPPARPTTAR